MGFRGLSLRPSILNRQNNSAQLCSNVEKTRSGKLTIRKATECQYAVQGSAGSGASLAYLCLFPFTYVYHDTTTGGQAEEQLWLRYTKSVNGNTYLIYLQKVVERAITITYIGAGVGTISMLPFTTSGGTPTKKWNLIVKEDGVQVYTTTFDTAQRLASSSISFSGVDALANWTVTDSGSGTGHIDAIAPFNETTFPPATPVTFPYVEGTTVVSTGISVDFTDANFVAPSALNFSNVLYFALGVSE